jgi:hypothetical protein
MPPSGKQNGAAALVPISSVTLAPPIAPAPAPRQAETDAQLLELWLFGRSPHTVRAYRREAAAYLAFLGARGRGHTTGTLGDLQAYAVDPAPGDPRAAFLTVLDSWLGDLQARLARMEARQVRMDERQARIEATLEALRGPARPA